VHANTGCTICRVHTYLSQYQPRLHEEFVLARFQVSKQLYGTSKSLTDNFRSLRFAHFWDITSQKCECITPRRKPEITQFQGVSLSVSSFVSISVVHSTPILILLATGNQNVWMRSGLHCRDIFNVSRIFLRWLVQSILPGQLHVQNERPLGLCTVAATRNNVSNFFPNTSSESDLQHYRAVWDRSSRERKSPSLSNVASDSLRHKVL